MSSERWREELLYSETRSTAALIQVISQLIEDLALLDQRLMKLEEFARMHETRVERVDLAGGRDVRAMAQGRDAATKDSL